MKVSAPAKINLFLDILARRGDGFHDLHTVFAAVDFCDELEIEGETVSTASPFSFHIKKFTVDGPHAQGVPTDKTNLVVRALRAYEAAVSRTGTLRLSIHLTKNVPHGAGLGGGSSDAAATLRAVNEMLGSPLEETRLAKVAASVGSDCAFFIRGGLAEGRGRGEVLTPITSYRQLYALIVIPEFAISTREAYASLRPEHLGAKSDMDGLRRRLAGETGEFPRLYNSFESALQEKHPELKIVRGQLSSHGALAALLSGSGSASFGLFDDEAVLGRAEKALEKMRNVRTVRARISPSK